MTRTVEITARCDGQKPYALAANGQPYRPGQFRPCGRSMTASSHKALTARLVAGGWIELASGILKCPECLERETRGGIIRFEKRGT